TVPPPTRPKRGPRADQVAREEAESGVHDPPPPGPWVPVPGGLPGDGGAFRVPFAVNQDGWLGLFDRHRPWLAPDEWRQEASSVAYVFCKGFRLFPADGVHETWDNDELWQDNVMPGAAVPSRVLRDFYRRVVAKAGSGSVGSADAVTPATGSPPPPYD